MRLDYQFTLGGVLVALTTIVSMCRESWAFQSNNLCHAFTMTNMHKKWGVARPEYYQSTGHGLQGRTEFILKSRRIQMSTNNDERALVFDRRKLLQVGSLVASNLFTPILANAASNTFSPPLDLTTSTRGDQTETGLLESRVTENLWSQPPYTLESADVEYPSFFGGTWQVTSTCTDIIAPCGLSLFGGNATYTRAREDIGGQNALVYKARFIGGSSGATSTVIADRDYNVREIAKAAMGSMSVVDVPMATPNKFTVVLAPSGAGAMIQVDMIALARRQENIMNTFSQKDTALHVDTNISDFHAAEVVRQIVSPISSGAGGSSANGGRRTAALIKEVETISLYEHVLPRNGEAITQVRCKQRSATYLIPRQDDPLAYRMWEASRGRPVDVRFYDVVYDKLK
jgi:hypothetical protein